MKDKKVVDSEYSTINNFISFMLWLLRYVALITCVVTVAVTMFLVIMLVMKGENIPTETLYETITVVADINEAEVTNYVETLGTVKVTLAFIGFYLGLAVSTGLLRAILNRYREVFDAIINGNAYEESTLNNINACLPLSVCYTFAQPIIIVIVIATIGIFKFEAITLSGISFLAVSYVGKLLIEHGYDLNKRNVKLAKELSDIKAYESELKMSIVKKQAEAKKLEKPATKTVAKKTTKKEEAKPVAKKVQKRATKKTTTK